MKQLTARKTVQRHILEALLLTFLTLLAPIMVYVDLNIFQHGVPEIGATEITQELFALISALLFTKLAYKLPQQRGFYTLVAGFFFCVVIRELDQFFDLIWHGFWLIPAILCAVVAIGYAVFRCQGSVLQPMTNFTHTKAYPFLLIGLLILLIFSRVFGSGSLFWMSIMGDAYVHGFKNALQEGLELLGYSFIFYSACLNYVKNHPITEKTLQPMPGYVQSVHH